MKVVLGQAETRDSALDGLRGFAALMVVASHASSLGMNLIPGLSLEGIGKYGVYLFFVISAYLLTAQWLGAPASRVRSPRYLGIYLARRVLRIFPLYVLVLLVGWALPPRGLGVPLDGEALWRHLTLREGHGIYWSVPVEFTYYLVIPVLAVWLRLPLHRTWHALGLLGLLALSSALFPSGEMPSNSDRLPYYLPVFVSGSAAAWLAQKLAVVGPRRRQSGVRAGLELVPLLVLVLSVPAVFVALGVFTEVDALHRSFIGWGLFWAALLLAVVSGRLPAWGRVMRWRGLRACGRWCFGIYLLHMPALYLAKKLPLPSLLAAWVGLTLALLLAASAFRVIERPAMDLSRRFKRPQ